MRVLNISKFQMKTTSFFSVGLGVRMSNASYFPTTNSQRYSQYTVLKYQVYKIEPIILQLVIKICYSCVQFF
jgi:hypothetical protein